MEGGSLCRKWEVLRLIEKGSHGSPRSLTEEYDEAWARYEAAEEGYREARAAFDNKEEADHRKFLVAYLVAAAAYKEAWAAYNKAEAASEGGLR